MNIYVHVEIAERELDSKLLLAVLAASRGHSVLIADGHRIMQGTNRRFLAPGIFYNKSLTPGDKKIAFHQSLVNEGFLVTSLDEEGGLVDHGYEWFAKVRYSEQTIGQASTVFGWGAEDTETLKRLYPAYSAKIHQTGSPRADMWRPCFAQYHCARGAMLGKPYLLVSSNMGTANNMCPLHKRIQSERRAGYYQRDPGRFLRTFKTLAEDYRKTQAFVEAIRHLAASSNQFEIVLRPLIRLKIFQLGKFILRGFPVCMSPEKALSPHGSITPSL